MFNIGFYILLHIYFFVIFKKIYQNGLNISSQQGSRIKQIKESLGSIRQLILSGKQNYFQ